MPNRPYGGPNEGPVPVIQQNADLSATVYPLVFFGATGDDGASITTALNTNNVVWLAPLTYTVNSTVTVGANQVVYTQPATVITGSGSFTGTQLGYPAGPVDWLNVRAYGAVGDGKTIGNGTMSASTNVLTSSSNPFKVTDVGKLVMVDQAGTGGNPLGATITAFNSAGSVTLSAACNGSGVSGVTAYWGTDNYTAFQAALTAMQSQVITLEATHYNLGIQQAMYIPYGIYMCGTALIPKTLQTFTILGGGALVVCPQSGFLNFATSGHQGNQINGLVEIAGFSVDCGGRHIFANCNLRGRLYIHDMQFMQRYLAGSIFWMDDTARADGITTSLYQALFKNIDYWQGFGTRSVGMWHLYSLGGSELTDITWEQINGPNPPGAFGEDASLDATQYQYELGCTSAVAGSIVSNVTFRNILAADFYGGLIKVDSGRHVKIQDSNIYNTNNSGSAITNDLFSFQTGPNNSQGCDGIEIRNVYRNNGYGTGWSGPPPYDVTFSAQCHNAIIESYICPPSNTNGPAFNLNGAPRVVIISTSGYGSGNFTIANIAADTVQIGAQDAAANSFGLNTSSPVIKVGGTPLGLAIPVTSQSGAYNIGALDYLILGNATSAGFTVTLPSAANITGKVYTVIKTDSSANHVTIGTTSSQTINGSTTQVLTSQYAKMTVASDGSNWWETA